jgi:methylenetetrahydrofolate reductase (NADPH)
MKIVDRLRSQSKPCIGFEFFPAKNPKAQEGLDRAIEKLTEVKPDFVTVTFGAGGYTREGSRQLAARLREDKEREVIAYFAGYGLGPQEISEALGGYLDGGVENILVVRGDPPRDPAFRPHPYSMVYASDLLDYIRPRYSFCLGAAGYPEGHVHSESPERDADFLKRKVDLGAEYILSNYFYDNRFFFDYVERCQARGVKVPILPGVMPILSLKLTESIAATCGASIPKEIRASLSAIPETDKKAAADYGIEFAERQCRELLAAGVPGILFYTMNRWESISEIVLRLRAGGVL